MGSGTFLPPRNRTSASERPASQRQRTPNIGAARAACSSTSRAVAGCRNRNTSASGKLCCSASEMLMPSSVAAACSSKLKERQKRLRSARPQALLIRAPNGAWMTSCMPPPSSKNRSATTVCCVGTAPSTARPDTHVVDGLLGARAVEAAGGHEPLDGGDGRGRLVAGVLGSGVRSETVDLGAKAGDVMRQFGRAGRRLAAPERNRRRRAVGVLHEHAPRSRHTADPPGRVAEEHDVTGHALDGEVLVDGADGHVVGLRDDRIEAGIGNGAAAGDRREAGAAAAAQPAVHAVAVQVGAVPAATRRNAVRQHRDDFVERRAGQLAVRKRARDQREQVVLAPLVGGAGGDDLLGEDVERRVRDDQPIQIALADGAGQRRAFDQLVARGGEQASLGHRAAPVARPADPLHRDRNRARGADLADEIDRADVDAQLERGRGDEHAQVARLQPPFGVEPNPSGEAAVVGGHGLRSQPLGQMVRHPFGQRGAC